MNGLERMWSHSQQQKKRLDKKLFDIFAENRNLRDMSKTLQEKMGSSAGGDTASNESPHRNITRLPNTNECGETWDDVLSSLNQYSNVSKSMEQAPGSPQTDVSQQSLDSVGHPRDSEKVVSEQILTKSLVSVT